MLLLSLYFCSSIFFVELALFGPYRAESKGSSVSYRGVSFASETSSLKSQSYFFSWPPPKLMLLATARLLATLPPPFLKLSVSRIRRPSLSCSGSYFAGSSSRPTWTLLDLPSLGFYLLPLPLEFAPDPYFFTFKILSALPPLSIVCCFDYRLYSYFYVWANSSLTSLYRSYKS